MADAVQGSPLPSLEEIYGARSLPEARIQYDKAAGKIDSSLLGAIIGDYDTIGQVSQQGLEATKKEMVTIEEKRKSLTAADRKRSEIEKYPEFVGNLLGLLDEDWDWEYQNAQVRAAKEGIALSQDYMTSVQTLVRLQQQMLGTQIDKRLQEHKMLMGAYDRALGTKDAMDKETKYQQGYALQLRADRRAEVSSMRDGLRLSMESERQTWARDQAMFTKEQMMAERLAPEQLQAIADGTDTSTGISKGVAMDALLGLQSAQTSLANAKLANEKDQIGLAEYWMKRALTESSDARIAALLKEAKESDLGVVMVGDVEIPVGVLQEVASERATKSAAGAAIAGDSLALPGRIEAAEEYINTVLNKWIAVTGATTNPGTGRLMAYPASMDFKIRDAFTQIKAKQSVGDTAGATTVLNGLVDSIEKERDDYIKKNYDEYEQEYIQQMTTTGRPTAAAAARYLGAQVLNPNSFALGGDSLLMPLAERLRDNMMKLIEQQGGGIDPAAFRGGDFSAVRALLSKAGKTTFEQMVQQALSMTGEDGQTLLKEFGKMQKLNATELALGSLKSVQTPSGAPGYEWMASISGTNSPLFLPDPSRPESDSNRRSLAAFLAHLQQNYDADVAAGKVDPAVVPSYRQTFMDVLSGGANRQQMYNYWMSGLSPQGQAMAQMVFGGAPDIGFDKWLQTEDAKWQDFYVKVKQDQDRLTEQLRRQEEAEETMKKLPGLISIPSYQSIQDPTHMPLTPTTPEDVKQGWNPWGQR